MRYFITILLGLELISCQVTNYTSSKYFDCKNKIQTESTSDKQILFRKILEMSVVTKKDVPGYTEMEDKTRIYVSDTAFSSFFGNKLDGSDIAKWKLEDSDIPNKIGKVKFCLKSRQQLQEIANATKDFIYLTLEDGTIKNDTAIIGISATWMQQNKTKPKYVYMSGGGYTFKYIKVNGEWILSECLRNWQS